MKRLIFASLFLTSVAFAAYTSLQPGVPVRTRIETDSTTLANAHASATAILKGRRDGQFYCGEIHITAAGAGSAAAITFTIPYTIDTGSLAGGSSTGNDRSIVGGGGWFDSGNQTEPVEVAYAGASTLGLIENTQTLYGNQLAAGDFVRANFCVPIVGW